jgi:hypothetical protein
MIKNPLRKILVESTKTNFIKQIVTFFSIFTFIFTSSVSLVFSLDVSAQSNTNEIGLYFPYVNRATEGRSATVKVGTNHYKYNGELSSGDEIRYAWQGVDLNLKYKDTPNSAGGYLKIYRGDDSSESNFILDHGSSPLPVDSLVNSLKNGENNLLFVYVNSTRPEIRSTKVLFTFNFKGEVSRPSLDIVSPPSGAIFAQGIDRDFLLKMENFSLSPADTGDSSIGKINVYYNKVDKTTFLGTLSSSIEDDGISLVEFNSEDLDFSRIPDSEDSTLIFVLTNSKGDLLNVRKELSIKTNFNDTLDLGLPKITITNPSDVDGIPTVDGDLRFILEVQNFELFEGENDLNNEEGVGFIQVRVDGELINREDNFTKESFTLNEMGVDLSEKTQAEIEVKLVNKDNTDLEPNAEDSILVKIQANEDSEAVDPADIQNNNWRIVIVVLTVILVVGGISILITKG